MSDEYRFVLKLETDGLDAQRILAVTLYDIDRHQVFNFSDQPGALPISEACDFLSVADQVIVQSNYALKTLRVLRGLRLDEDKVVDNLKMARSMTHQGGNSLDAWAREFDMHRHHFKGANEWSEFVQRHCETDAILIASIFEHLREQVTV
jgi:hypothetical protein